MIVMEAARHYFSYPTVREIKHVLDGPLARDANLPMGSMHRDALSAAPGTLATPTVPDGDQR